MIKAAFFDIDWTLYDHASHQYISSGIEAIKKLKKQGVKCFICTARPYNSMKLFGIFDLGIHWDGYICSAGAIAHVGRKCVRKLLMDKADVYAICHKAESMGYTVEIVCPQSRFLIAPPNQYVDGYHYVYQYQLPRVHRYHGEDATGLLLFSPKESDEEIFSVRPHLDYYRFHECAVDVSGEPHSKGDAIVDVLKELGINKEETISFGDDIQDISMEKETGIFVCMGNGKPEVKEAANYVTDRIEDDGIAHALEHFHLI